MTEHPRALVTDEEGLVGGIDWLGNAFRIGDLVMYCISAGRGQMMAVGEVVAIRAKPVTEWANQDEYAEWHAGTRTRENYRPRYEIVDAVVEVQVLTAKTSGSWDNKARTRPAWVNSMNITSMKGVRAKR